LQEKLREGLSELGFKLESRKFRPHLTLGRFRDGRKAGKVLDEEMFKRVGTLEANFTADRVNLMQSRLNPSGAIYTVLKEHRLSG
jgi:2'-5' RNA ligase